MDASRYVVGVDLGTTYSAAAVASLGSSGGDNLRADIVTLGHTSAVLPSVVLVRADGEVLTGEAAERRSASEPGRVAREFKRRLGDPVPLVLGGTPYGAEALSGHLLRQVVASVSAQQGGPPATVVVTHPANYGEYKLDLLREAVRLAGLDDTSEVRFLTEPEAAATHYAQQERLNPGEVVAVYDFGGGTFDAAVVRVGEHGFELIGTPEGMDRLGGIDFDQAVYSHVVDSLGGVVEDLDPTDPAVMAGLMRLRDQCRSAKEALSSDTDVDVPVALPSVHTEVRITRVEFEAMIRPRITETIESLVRAVRSAGLDIDAVDKVLLVGGSSRIPLVAEMVQAATGRPVAVDAHPKHAIAAGAALHAAGLHAASLGAGALGAAGAAAAAAGVAAGMLPPPIVQPEVGAPVTGSDGPGADSRRRMLMIVAAVLVVALVAAGLVFGLGSGDGDDLEAGDASVPETTTEGVETSVPAEPEGDGDDDGGDDDQTDVIITAGEVILEPFTAEGSDPFIESVAFEPTAVLLAFVARGGTSSEIASPSDPGGSNGSGGSGGGGSGGGATTLVSRVGTDPGVYGGTQNEQVCDTDQLVTVLGERPAESEAWAEVHRIETDEIGEYVDTLTAVALTTDVRVTNHGFVDDKAVPRQAVLQVGTAVLVDDLGVPRVRCSSGSPLLPPEPVQGTTRYTGAAWETFTPETTAAIAPAPEPVEEFLVIDVETGEEFTRPVGSNGSQDLGGLPAEIVATGELGSLVDFDGAFESNEVVLTFPSAGGPVTGTLGYVVNIDGLQLTASGDFTGNFDPTTMSMIGTVTTIVAGGGFSGDSEVSPWSATVDPETGVVTGVINTDEDSVDFVLNFDSSGNPQDS